MFKRNDRPKNGFNALRLGVSFVFASSCIIGIAYADTLPNNTPSSALIEEAVSTTDSTTVSTTLAAGDLYVAPNGNV